MGEAAEGLFNDWPALVDDYLGRIDVSPRTRDRYQEVLIKFGKFLAGQTPTPDHIIAYKKHLESQKLAPNTINVALSAIGGLFKLLAAWRRYPDIAKMAGKPHIRRPEGFQRRALTQEEAQAFLATFKGSSEQALRDRALACVMLMTGIRVSGGTHAKIQDLLPEHGRPALRVRLKGGRDGLVILPETARAAVQTYLDKRPGVRSDAPLFASCSNQNRGDSMTREAVRLVMRKHLALAGIKDPAVVMHSIRHTAATLALESGASVAAVQLMLGHQSPSTTAIYTKSLDRAKNAAEDRVERSLLEE